MVKASYLESLDLPKVVNEWLKHFEAALSTNRFSDAANLFVDQGQWRDLLAFTWHIRTMSGKHEILHTLQQTTPKAKPTGLSLAEERTPPRGCGRTRRHLLSSAHRAADAHGALWMQRWSA